MVPELPVSGVALLLGNDIAGGKVIRVLEVIDTPPTGAEGDELSNAFPMYFPLVWSPEHKLVSRVKL